MIKLILNADASIKLSKISLIEELADAFVIILTKEVYEEQVVVGLKKGYSDAKRVDTLVKSQKIEVIEVASTYDDHKLGKGERSVIDCWLSVGADLVVSDDEAFLRVLDRISIPYTPVAGSILMLVRHGRLTKRDGIKYLNSLKYMIREEHLFYVNSWKGSTHRVHFFKCSIGSTHRVQL